MASTDRCCLLISLLFFLLLASTVYAAQLVADANDTGADGKRVTVREGIAGGHAHGYNSHSTHNPNGTPEDGGDGTTVVDPRNLAVRSHNQRGGASRTVSYPRLAACGILGAVFVLVLV